jgi:hypothetical protein
MNRSRLIIVPNEHYGEVNRRIEAIREADEPKRLEYDCENLKDSLINNFGVPCGRKDLVVGRRYGVLGYSMSANAVRKGEVIRNHGEIYLYVWTYHEDGVFRQTDAWSGIHESRIPGCPLIEL